MTTYPQPSSVNAQRSALVTFPITSELGRGPEKKFPGSVNMCLATNADFCHLRRQALLQTESQIVDCRKCSANCRRRLSTSSFNSDTFLSATSLESFRSSTDSWTVSRCTSLLVVLNAQNHTVKHTSARSKVQCVAFHPNTRRSTARQITYLCRIVYTVHPT